MSEHPDDAGQSRTAADTADVLALPADVVRDVHTVLGQLAGDSGAAPRLDLTPAHLAAFMRSDGGTRLYGAARQLADDTVGHAESCEWHTNKHAYCSCPAYGAACAGVDATLETLANAYRTWHPEAAE